MDIYTIAREVEVLLSDRRRVSELLIGLLTHPTGLGENTDHLIAGLFDRDAGPLYSTDAKAARSLVEDGEGVFSTALGAGIWGAEVYQVAPTINGIEADQWQTRDCEMDVEAVGHGEAAAIVSALIIVRAVQAAQLLDLARGSPALIGRLDLARGCFGPAPAPVSPCPSEGVAPPMPLIATSTRSVRGALRGLLGRVRAWARGARR